MEKNSTVANTEETRPSVKEMLKALAPVIITSALTSAACFVIANRIANSDQTEA